MEKEFLKSLGAREKDISILEEYFRNPFIIPEPGKEPACDIEFLKAWERIFDHAAAKSAADALNRYMVPVERYMTFEEPDLVELVLHHTPVGGIPVIKAGCQKDFETLVVQIIYKGKRPQGLESTGASFAYGKKTRFIILSNKDYSNVPAEEIGITEEEWKDKSMKIRLEHECTHYFTKQVLGSSRNNLYDECIADFFGILYAFGEYRADWFLRFLGLRGSSGRRLKFYMNELPEETHEVVSRTAVQAAESLEKWSRSKIFSEMDDYRRKLWLCSRSICEWCQGGLE